MMKYIIIIFLLILSFNVEAQLELSNSKHDFSDKNQGKERSPLCIECHTGYYTENYMYSDLCLSCHINNKYLENRSHPLVEYDMFKKGLHSTSNSFGNFYTIDEVLKNGKLECVTCHDPHNNQYGMFLRMSNEYSQLCMTCHNK